jgi:hypothetical protein
MEPATTIASASNARKRPHVTAGGRIRRPQNDLRSRSDDEALAAFRRPLLSPVPATPRNLADSGPSSPHGSLRRMCSSERAQSAPPVRAGLFVVGRLGAVRPSTTDGVIRARERADAFRLGSSRPRSIGAARRRSDVQPLATNVRLTSKPVSRLDALRGNGGHVFGGVVFSLAILKPEREGNRLCEVASIGGRQIVGRVARDPGLGVAHERIEGPSRW